MSNLEPELLKVLIAFAESKNLIEAAQKLQITQPAVSQRLHRLEGQVLKPIATFLGRKKILTPYGKALYDVAKENWNQLQRSIESIDRKHSSGDHLAMRVGGRSELFDIFGSAVQFSGRLEYNNLKETEIIGSLEKDEIDVGLASSPANVSNIISKKIFEGSSRFICHSKILSNIRNFRDLQRNKELLYTTPCILHRTESVYSDKFFNALKVNLAELNCKALVEDWTSVHSLVTCGSGYAIVPAFMPRESKRLLSFEIPHALVPQQNYYVIFHRKFKQIETFQKALTFPIHSS